MALPALPLINQRRSIGFTIESATNRNNGTPATVSAMSALLVYDPRLTYLDPTSQNERRSSGVYGSELTRPPGAKSGRVSFTVEVSHHEDFDDLCSCCRMLEAVNTMTPTNVPANWNTATFKMWHDGRYKSIRNAMGSVTFMIENGGRIMANFTFIGVVEAAADEAMPAQTVVTSVASYLSNNATCTWGGSAIPRWSRMDIAIENNIFLRPDGARAGGIAHALPGTPSFTVSVDFDAHLVADFNPHAAQQAGTAQALSCAFNNGTNTLTFAAPKAQIASVEDGARDNIGTDEVTFILADSVGDDAYSIARG